jgi:plasmid stability protein
MYPNMPVGGDQMAILHARNVPEDLYANLKALAKAEGRSLSAQVVILLAQALRGRSVRSQAEVLKAIDSRPRFNPRQAGAPSTTELLRQDRAR